MHERLDNMRDNKTTVAFTFRTKNTKNKRMQYSAGRGRQLKDSLPFKAQSQLKMRKGTLGAHPAFKDHRPNFKDRRVVL